MPTEKSSVVDLFTALGNPILVIAALVVALTIIAALYLLVRKVISDADSILIVRKALRITIRKETRTGGRGDTQKDQPAE